MMLSFVFIFTLIRFYLLFFFFSSRRRHTRSDRDWSSDVCSSDLKRFPQQNAPCRRRKEGAHHGRRIDWISGRDTGDGSPSRGAVYLLPGAQAAQRRAARSDCPRSRHSDGAGIESGGALPPCGPPARQRRARLHRCRAGGGRKSTRLNSSHDQISYAVVFLKKKKKVR